MQQLVGHVWQLSSSMKNGQLFHPYMEYRWKTTFRWRWGKWKRESAACNFHHFFPSRRDSNALVPRMRERGELPNMPLSFSHERKAIQYLSCMWHSCFMGRAIHGAHIYKRTTSSKARVYCTCMFSYGLGIRYFLSSTLENWAYAACIKIKF